jgi:hypothetical protein
VVSAGGPLTATRSIFLSSPMLSALAYDAGVATCDIEGLLFGHKQTRSVGFTSDSEEAGEKKVSTVIVQSFHRCLVKGSFYDQSGHVSLPALQEVCAQHAHMDLVGWFVGRKQSRLEPGIRELAVHRSLLRQLQLEQSDCPFAFGVVSFDVDHRLETQNLDYRFMEVRVDNRGDGPFVPLSAKLQNFSIRSQEEYSAFHACSAFGPPDSDQTSAFTAFAVPPQTDALDQHFGQCVTQAEALMLKLKEAELKAAALRAENAELRTRVAAATAGAAGAGGAAGASTIHL